MKITVIGFWGAYPEKMEATSAYLVQTDKINLLLDCGSGALSLLQNHIKLEELDAVILTHYHGDHSADVKTLQYSALILNKLGKRTNPLELYGVKEEPDFSNLNYGKVCKGIEINSNSILNLGDLTLTFSDNIHPVTCLAVKVQQGEKSFVHTSDTQWNDNLLELCKNSNVIFSECNLYNEQLGMVPGHLTAGEAGRLAKLSEASKLILTHLPHHGNHNDLLNEAKEEFHGSIELAKSNLVIEI